MAMPQCCYSAKGAKRPSHTTDTIKFDRIPFDPCNSIKRFDLCPFDQKNSTYLQPPVLPTICFSYIMRDVSANFFSLRRFGIFFCRNVRRHVFAETSGILSAHPLHMPHIMIFPFDPCNSIKRIDLRPFDLKNSTYFSHPGSSTCQMTSHTQLLMPHIDVPVCDTTDNS